MKIIKPKPVQKPPKNAKVVYRGVIFDILQWQQKMYDGSVRTFERARRNDVVVVFPVTNDGKIILTEQIQPRRKKFLSAPGGMVDNGESIISAVKRELREEAGCVASKLELWYSGQPSSKIDFSVYIFIAKGVKKICDICPDGGEKIKLKYLNLDELIEVAYQNKLNNKEIICDLIKAKYNLTERKKIEKLFGIKEKK